MWRGYRKGGGERKWKVRLVRLHLLCFSLIYILPLPARSSFQAKCTSAFKGTRSRTSFVRAGGFGRLFFFTLSPSDILRIPPVLRTSKHTKKKGSKKKKRNVCAWVTRALNAHISRRRGVIQGRKLVTKAGQLTDIPACCSHPEHPQQSFATQN